MSGHATMATTTTTRMYPVRPVVVLPDNCAHRRSMYEMRNIHDFHEDRRDDRRRRPDADPATGAKMPVDVVTQASLPEYEALEARQEKVLGQLAELKKQVSRLFHVLKNSNQVEPTTNLVAVQVQKPIFINLVLKANPSKPPYSLLALQKLWNDTNFNVTAYTHSSISGQIPIVFPRTTNYTRNVVDITLIWKEVSNMEVITDMRSHLLIGEANFLRYVSKIIESHNYESTFSQPHTLDIAIDFINTLHNEQRIEKGLLVLAREFDKWSCKGGFNIVDIAVWSLIKQFPGTRLQPILRKWYTLCETTFTETDSLINHDK